MVKCLRLKVPVSGKITEKDADALHEYAKKSLKRRNWGEYEYKVENPHSLASWTLNEHQRNEVLEDYKKLKRKFPSNFARAGTGYLKGNEVLKAGAEGKCRKTSCRLYEMHL
tara:strand:+ start:104 stop:439 length:336 start_codon:yes stop_codon:yes gene_type:complete